jgi:hypothetical protein
MLSAHSHGLEAGPPEADAAGKVCRLICLTAGSVDMSGFLQFGVRQSPGQMRALIQHLIAAPVQMNTPIMARMPWSSERISSRRIWPSDNQIKY